MSHKPQPIVYMTRKESFSAAHTLKKYSFHFRTVSVAFGQNKSLKLKAITWVLKKTKVYLENATTVTGTTTLVFIEFCACIWKNLI